MTRRRTTSSELYHFPLSLCNYFTFSPCITLHRAAGSFVSPLLCPLRYRLFIMHTGLLSSDRRLLQAGGLRKTLLGW
jgi:hypothetical protein